MGLGFTIHTKIKDIEKFQQAVESQAVESGYNAEHDESSSTVSFCRLGDLFLNYQHEGEGNTDNVIFYRFRLIFFSRTFLYIIQSH